MHEAVIALISEIVEIPGAKTIALAKVAGFQVIVGKDTQVGDLGILFEGGLQLSHEMCYFNNLYHHPDLNLDKEQTGYIEDNRKIQTKRFMKQQSEGLWLSINRLSWAGNISNLTPGTLLKELNGKPICDKYFTKATHIQHNDSNNKIERHRAKKHRFFPLHFETEQLRQHICEIPVGAILIISQKNHGTSGRTGLICCSKADPESSIQFNWFQKLWNQAANSFSFLPEFPQYYYEWISGTRRTEMDSSVTDNGWFSGKKFRAQIHNYFKDKIPFESGMIVYYEICGFCEDGTSIMPPHKIEDKELKKQYGERMLYTYGCNSTAEVDMSIHNQYEDIVGKYRVLVYRISRSLADETEYELPWYEVVRLCNKWGLETVPVLETIVYNGEKDALIERCKFWADQKDILGPHIREGVCVRVEASKTTTILKHKSFWFRVLEGLKTDQEDFVDPEDVS